MKTLWETILNFFKALVQTTPKVDPPKSPSTSPPKSEIPSPEKTYKEIALEYEGVAEVIGPGKNPTIAEFHKYIGSPDFDEDDSWCASFMGYVMGKAGYGHSGKANARSYLNMWEPTEFFPWCVAVFWRESKDSWKGHVAFAVEDDGDNIRCFGGNQDNKVCYKRYPKSQLLGYRKPVKAGNRIALSWETNLRPHRKAWSDELTKLIRDNLAVYAIHAKDVREFIPSWDKMTNDQCIKALGELWVAMAKYESGWNQASYSVDVGNKENKDTWSVGLYQLSVVDQKNLNLPFGYDFEDLQDPIKNITLAHAIMMRQIRLYKRLALDNNSKGRYWAVMLHGNKYSKIAEIKADMKAAGVK